MKLLIINGPNLNFLEKRNISDYGGLSLAHIEELMKTEFPEIEFTFTQSNIEGEICNWIQEAPFKFHGIIINPGGFTHTSVSIRDSLELITIPVIEVHLSNLSDRDNFRKTQITSGKSLGYISGFKENSYLAAVYLIRKVLLNKSTEAK